MSIDLYADRKHVLFSLSAGAGASPCIDMAKWLLAKGKVAKARFIWSYRILELEEDAPPKVLWDDSAETGGIGFV